MKKGILKKLLAMTLALTMVTAAAGCGQEAEKPASSEAKQESSEVKAESSSAASTEETPAEPELEYVKVKFLNRGSKPETGNHDKVWADINAMLLEELNCEVEIEYGGGQKDIALKYAANEVFDFAFDASWFGYATNAAANAYREVTMEEIQEYMPLVYEQLPAIAWEQSKIDDKIYMIPCLTAIYGMGVSLIRGDLREKYGIEPLENPDDLIEYCKAIAEGKDVPEPMAYGSYIGVVFGRENVDKLPIGGGFNYNTYFTDDLDTSPVVYSGGFEKESLEYYKLMRNFYEWGFWAEDAISDSTADKVKFENGLTAVHHTNLPTADAMANQLSEAHPEWKVEIYALNADHPSYVSQYTSNGFSINRNAENPERAMMVLNLLMADPEYNHLLYYGYEGINYEYNEQGQMVLLSADGDDKHDPGCLWAFESATIAPEMAGHYPGYDEIMEKFEANRVDYMLQAFVFDESNIQTEKANTSAVGQEYTALNYGMVEDVEKAFEAKKKAYYDAGLQTMIDECQRQVDEFLSK